MKYLLLAIAFFSISFLAACDSSTSPTASNSTTNQQQTTNKDTVVVYTKPTNPFTVTYNTWTQSAYSNGVIGAYQATYNGTYTFRFNQGTNNDVSYTLNGTVAWMINKGKLPNFLTTGGFSCDRIQVNDNGVDAVIGYCTTGAVVYWNATTFISFTNP